MDYIYELAFEVRDNECDVQGVVNNGQYQNYLTHARHKFIQSEGINFNNMVKEGKIAMVSRVEMDYLAPLLPDEQFTVKISLERNKSTRLIFCQDIFKADGTQSIRARVTTVCVDETTKRPLRLEEVYEGLYKKYNL